MRKLAKAENKDTRTMSMASFCEHIWSFVLIIDFEQAKVCWVPIEKIKLLKARQVYYTLCYSNLSVTKMINK